MVNEIQSPRLMKMKELSDELNSFFFSSYNKSTTFLSLQRFYNKQNKMNRKIFVAIFICLIERIPVLLYDALFLYLFI